MVIMKLKEILVISQSLPADEHGPPISFALNKIPFLPQRVPLRSSPLPGCKNCSRIPVRNSN